MSAARRRRLLGAGLSLAVFVLVAALVQAGSLDSLDGAILRWAEGLGPGARAGARLPTILGSWIALALVVVGVALWAHRRGRRAGAGVLVGGALLSEALNLLLKFLFGRARPDAFAEALPLTPAFPSGHAMVPIVVYPMSAWLVASLRPRWRRPAVAAAAMLALASGLSRIVLGVHWPSDVIGGFAAGLSLAFLGRIALDATAARDC